MSLPCAELNGYISEQVCGLNQAIIHRYQMPVISAQLKERSALPALAIDGYTGITTRVNKNMLARLLVEHDHILKTLNLLEMQFVDLCRGGKPDYSLMRSILEYISEYPEQIHHPLEDRIFSILLERVDEVDLIRDLISEHTELEAQTRKLRESIKLLQSGVISEEEIVKQLSAFLIRQRQHMYTEEQKVHPLIQRFITSEEWEQVQSSVPLYKD